MTEHGTGILNPIDKVIRVEDEQAFDMCKQMALCGFMVGGSSGVNIEAARTLANEIMENNTTTPTAIVTLLCDNGLKYLSKIF